MHKKLLIATLLAGIALSGAAQAALIDRGGGMIYDTDLNITWLADANYAMTSGYDADGRMTWAAANTWADNLVYGGYDDWRLPTAFSQDGTGPCAGSNCTGSEMGHLFYSELGGTARRSILSSGDPDLALFQNIQSFQSYGYWFGTESNPNSAWYFRTSDGFQNVALKRREFYAWAVRSGDVAVAQAVSEPASLALLGLGLAGLAFVRRRR